MKKTLIALAAAATLAVGLSGAAKADSIWFGVGSGGHPHFGASLGYGGYGGYGYPYWGAGYGGGDCGPRLVKTWRYDPWVGHKVRVLKKVWACY